MSTDSAVDQTTRDVSSAHGLDASPETRPGVPMEASPAPDPGAHWQEPVQQEATVEILHRASLDGPTPVFGSAQPPRGISGALRRLGYSIPEHRARRWMMLLLADRIDTAEHRVAGLLTLDRREYRALAQDISSQPVRWGLLGLGSALLVRRLAGR